jgi:hypothetical protein
MDETEVTTDHVGYTVAPTTKGADLPPVRLTARSRRFTLQDYFTAEQAIELGRSLIEQGEAVVE